MSGEAKDRFERLVLTLASVWKIIAAGINETIFRVTEILDTIAGEKVKQTFQVVLSVHIHEYSGSGFAAATKFT